MTVFERIRAILGQFGARGRTRVGKRDIAIVAGRVVMVLAGLELAYVIGANALLRSNGVVALVQGAEGVKLDYASAYSIVPGHIHVRRLRLRFEDYNVQFQVFLEKGTIDVGLTELIFKKFHAYSLLADGVSFRMRHKSHGVGSNGERFAAYPKIEGFADPPLYHGTKPPPTPDDQYDLWQIRIDNVVAHANELWVLEYRHVGDSEARGSFSVQPERLVQVEAALQIRSGNLMVGEVPVARQFAGSISCSVPHLDVKNTAGLEVLHGISTKLDVRLQDGDLRFLNVYGAPEHEPSWSGPVSSSLQARITRGVVESGSQLVAAAPAVRLAWPDVTLATQLGLSVGRLQPDPELNINVSLQNASLSSRHSTLAGPTARQATATLTLEGVDLTKPIRPAGAQIATEARLANLAWFDGLFDATSRLRFAGSADATLELTRKSPGGGEGHVELDVKKGRVRSDDFDVHSDVHAISRFRTQEAPVTSAQGAISFRVSDGDTLLSLAVGPAAQKLLSAGLNLGVLSGNVAFHAAERGLELELTQAKCGAVSGRGHFRQPARGSGLGAALLSAGPIHVGLRLEKAQTETSPLVDSDWLEQTWQRLQGLPPQG
ncbi:MAG TPA: hypothetical protein VHP33_04910 [Polyangiaceae bacterium]|nr:hypothetical protein [Polyangiaceae bacterium]